MAEKLPYIQFYPGDWLRDAISGCSLAAQGLWLRMMIVAHDSDRYGYLEVNGSPMQAETIARRCGVTLPEYETLLSELSNCGIPGTSDTGSLFSRRMSRDGSLRAVRAKAGRKGGQQTAKQKRSKRPPKPKQNPEGEDEDANGIEFKEELTPILDVPEFRKALGLWLKYKKQRRESYKPAGLSGVIDAAEARAKSNGVQAVIEAMQTARANGWQGWDQKSLFGISNGTSKQTTRVGAGQRYRG